MTARLQRVAILAAMAVVTLNLWTGAPLLGLWVGSRVAPESGISMLAVLVIVVVIGASAWALLRILAWLQLSYARLGEEPTPRRQTAWLKPMSGQRTRGAGGQAPPLSATDYVVVGVVILAIAAFEIWFFFYSGSSLDARSGR